MYIFKHLHIFTSSHLLILHLHIFSSSHLFIFTPSHLHTFSSSHLLIFTPSHLHIFSSSHLLIFTSSLSFSLALLLSCPLALFSLLLFYFSLKGVGQCQRGATKCNLFARNEVRSSKTEVKLRFSCVRRNPFALNEGRSAETDVNLRFSCFRRNLLARNVPIGKN